MAENTKIEWATHTANLWWGCTEVHDGCDNCYARTFARRVGKADGWDGLRYATRGIWNELPRWDAAAEQAGRVDSVFCGSMMDIFEKSMPLVDWKGNPMPGADTGQLRDRYLREVVSATPNLLHLLLTKRPSNILKMVPPSWLEHWPPHVMTGTSPVDQPTADTLLPQLMRVPGRHFLSMEPLLGPVAIRPWLTPIGVLSPDPHGRDQAIDWVICGGESGPAARPMHPQWTRDLRDQCVAANVPFHFKQNGEFASVSEVAGPGAHHTFPDGATVRRVGKKAAGRLLDGRTWDGFPS